MVNAIQRSVMFAFQLSTREGFGLTVSEVLWKYTPVIDRRARGIPLQVYPLPLRVVICKGS